MSKIEFLENGNIKIKIPITLKMIGLQKKIIITTEDKKSIDTTEISAMSINLARAFRWRKFLDDGIYSDSGALADALKIDRASVNRTLRLTFLSPEIVHAILRNSIPSEMTTAKLREQIPVIWDDQNKFFGFKNSK